MKRLVLTCALLVASGAAFAQSAPSTMTSVRAVPEDRAYVTVAMLAEETGLRQGQVRMLLGSYTLHLADWRTSYHRANRQFRAALGEARYHALLAGQPIRLRSGEWIAVAD